MKKPDGRTIARTVLFISTVVSLITSIQLTSYEFDAAAVAFLITGVLLLVTIVVFSKTRQQLDNSTSTSPEEPINSDGIELKRGTLPLVIGSFFAFISLFLILDSASGKYSGSGGMGGLVNLVYLAVVGPLAAIFIIIGLAMRLFDSE